MTNPFIIGRHVQVDKNRFVHISNIRDVEYRGNTISIHVKGKNWPYDLFDLNADNYWIELLKLLESNK